MTTTKPKTLEVGMGATLVVGSDRYPYVIRKITYFKSGARIGQPKAVDIQRVEVTAEKFPHGGGLVHLDRPYGPVRTATVKRDGSWTHEGSRVVVGVARYYNDPSF